MNLTLHDEFKQTDKNVSPQHGLEGVINDDSNNLEKFLSNKMATPSPKLIKILMEKIHDLFRSSKG